LSDIDQIVTRITAAIRMLVKRHYGTFFSREKKARLFLRWGFPMIRVRVSLYPAYS
jgi:hypothetical protein